MKKELAAAPTPPAQEPIAAHSRCGKCGNEYTVSFEYGTIPRTPPVQPPLRLLFDTDIERIALECGFKKKEQPDGRVALNPYVYRFARQIVAASDARPETERNCFAAPVQEAEPVLYQMWHPNFPTWVNCSKDIAEKFAATDPSYEIRGLYTRTQSDELRKAAEAVLDYWEKDGGILDDVLENLRAALEKK